MRLGERTNGKSCELQMQETFERWLKEGEFCFKREVRAKKVGRIADFLVLKKGNILINIEAKTNVTETLMKQLNDHAKYCDYSFAFVPDFSITPKWFKSSLTRKGYGLIVYNYKEDIITEVLEAHYNKPKLRNLRKNTIKRLNK